MDTRLKVPPTKSTLLDLKKQLTNLEVGYELLERKREILTRLVYQRLKDYRKLRSSVKEVTQQSYFWVAIAQMHMGSKQLKQLALGMEMAIKVKILPRSHLGIEYPSIAVETLPIQPIGLLKSDASVDEARIHLLNMTRLFAELGEAEISLLRILEEQIKTQKRVNALRYNVIPKYKNTIKFIQSNLEEEERNTLFQLKTLSESKNKNS
ncbi:MAG: V-type ATP synthase subunit D [Gammaproteobacteria bacterium]|nr:V-type ATP synthase subunit D [Gammaproteobacteria bacterium]